MMMKDKEPQRLDERFRKAEQYTFELDVPKEKNESCPYHKAFTYECPYCNPR